MKKFRRLRSLLSLTVAAQVFAGALYAAPFQVRSAVRTEAAVAEALDAGDETVRVLIVAREALASFDVDASANAVERRRAMADASTAEIHQILDAHRPLGVMSDDSTVDLWACNTVVADVDADTLAELQGSSSVQRILVDREVQWLSNDELTPAEEPAAPTNYGLAKIAADRAHSERDLSGEGVRVGIIDTGIDGEHPEVAGKVDSFKDLVQNKTEPYDDQGHGTHCAGTIAGTNVGVAPGAKLVVAKALNRFGGGSLSGLLEAMQWMMDPDGDPSTDDQPDLVSNSWGADADALGDSRELFRDVVKAWRQAGIVPVFAAGNSGPDTRAVPGGYPESFAVGATDKDDNSASFSTGGEIEFDGETFLKPDVSAPGVRIISAKVGGGYRALNGTSMACPHVAGAMALTLQAHPGASVGGLEEAFKAGSLDLGAEGRDDRFGEGRIDVMATLEVLDGQQVQ